MKKRILFTISMFLIGSTIAQTTNETQGTGAGVNITTGDHNAIYGDSAGYNVTSGSGNTLMGRSAGFNITTAGTSWDVFADPTGSFSTPTAGNVAIGQGAGYKTTLQYDNTFIGTAAGYSSTAYDNTFIGAKAGRDCTTGDDNVFIGEECGLLNTTGDENVFVGEDSGRDNTTGSDNTFIGRASGRMNETGSKNTFIGHYAGYDNTTGIWNTFVGDSSGLDGSTGNFNTMLGHASGPATEYGSHNTFIGNNSGWDNNRSNNTNGGARNTYLGSESGRTNREGSDNVVIGYNADFGGNASNNTAQNNQNIIIGAEAALNSSRVGGMVFGYSAMVNQDYGMAFGYNSNVTGNSGIGIGYNTIVTATNAMALGTSATANELYSVALGANSLVDTTNAFVVGGVTSTDRMTLGIGTTKPNQNSSIDLAETDKGFLINRVTNSERAAMVVTAVEEGMMVYDTEDDALYSWDGTAWNTTTDTDQQDLSLTGNTLSLTNDGTTVDLSAYLDNTDTQLTEAEVDAFVANNGYLTSFTEVDGDATNEIQDISLVGTDLTISSGSTIDLSGIDTDTQLTEAEVDAFVANNGYLTSFTEVDGDATNELQDLSLTGNTLNLSSSAATVDLTAYLDNTDQQNLTAATLTGNILQIDIENGSSVSVDLTPLLADLQNQINLIDDRLTIIEGCACDSTAGIWDNGGDMYEEAILYQNIPNPFNNTSSIKYYIPSWANSANLVVSNDMGQIVSNFDLHEVGDYGQAYVNAEGLTVGTYFYTLYVNQAVIDTKKMVVQ
jgi:trimeric autotransporter adhesin